MLPLKNFDSAEWISVAEKLVCADEPLMALKFLEMVPGYYRDNYPPELLNLKREIMAKIATASFYATDAGCELESTDEGCESYINTLRANLIIADVKAANTAGHIMHVYDFAPGENWLPVVLAKHECSFYYKPIYVNHPTYQKFEYRFKKYLAQKEDVPVLFSACEVIEHMHDPREVRFDMEKYVGLADVIHVSTPKYTYNPYVTDWRTIGTLGHLRTWTPREFSDYITNTFPEYERCIYDSQILHARLFNPKTKYESLKINYEVSQ